MALIKNGTLVEDSYRQCDGVPNCPPGDALLPASRWPALRETVRGRNGKSGLHLQPEDDPEALADDLHMFDMIALSFPHFKDGRAFTQAYMLRTRLGFKGEIRATGHVIPDQYRFLLRSGFDTVAVEDGTDPAPWAEALAMYSTTYQPGAEGTAPAPWRRHGAS